MKSKIRDLNLKYVYKNYELIAEWVLIFWFIIPVLMGIVNYVMLVSFNYDAYIYNDCYRIVANGAMALMFVASVIIAFSILIYKRWGIKDVCKYVFSTEKWLVFGGALLIWSLVCVFTSANPTASFWGATSLSSGYISYLYVLGLMFCASLIRDKKERVKLLELFCIICDWLVLLMLSYEYSIPILKNFSAGTGLSVYTNSNHFGYILSMAILCMAGLFFMYLQEDSESDIKKRKTKIVFCFISFVAGVYALMINDTLGVFFAVFFGLIVLMVFWIIRSGRVKPSYFILIITLICFTGISFTGLINNELGSSIGPSLVKLWKELFKITNKTSDYRTAGTNRWGLWIDAVKAILRRPILGYGPDIQYDLQYNRYIDEVPHNEYLECAMYLGIPGLVMYLGGLICLCVDRCKKLKNLHYSDIVAAGALIGYLISAATGVRKYYTSPYMFVFLGMIIMWGKGEKNDKDNKSKIECEEEKEVLLTKDEPETDMEKTLQEEKQITVEKEKEQTTFEEKKQVASSDKKKNSIYAKLENFGISKACAYILLAWTVIPFIAAIGFIPIGLKHAAEGVLLHTYYQIMYNFSIVCVIGIVGFILFMTILSGKRDANPMTTKQIIIDKTKKEVWNVLLIALLFWSFISACLSDTVVTSFIGTALKRDGFLAYCMYASVFGLAYFIGDNRWIKRFLICYSAIASIMCLVMMFYEWQIPILVYMSHYNSCASFMNPNHFGYYLGMSIMCLFGLFFMDLYRAKGKNEKTISKVGIYYIVSFGWQVYALMINNSLGTFVGIVCAIIISMIFWRIRVGRLGIFAWIPGVIVIVITFISYMGWINNIWGETVGESLTQFVLDLFIVAEHAEGFEKAGTNRIGLWIEALKLIPRRPIFGYGPEGLTGHFQDVNTYDRPHNEYLQLAVFCGIPALLMYLSALITLCVDRCKQLKTISPMTIAVAGVVIGYLANAFFGFTLYYTTPYFFVFLGFVAGSAKNKTE